VGAPGAPRRPHRRLTATSGTISRVGRTDALRSERLGSMAPGALNSDYPPNSENPGPSRLLSPVRSRVPGTFLAPPAREPIGRQIDLGYDLLKRIYSTI
jgi:hypothetical protein